MSDQLQSSLMIDPEAMRFISHNISDAVPSRKLEEAIQEFSLEPIYAAALKKNIPVERIIRPFSSYNVAFMPSLYSWLKKVKFDGGKSLYAEKLKPFHRYLKHHLAKYYEDETLTFLVAVFNRPLRDRAWAIRLNAIRDHLFHLNRHQKDIDFQGLKLVQPQIQFYYLEEYRRLIVDFLEDPTLSMEYALDGTRLPPGYDQKTIKMRRNLPWTWRKQHTNKGTLAARLMNQNKRSELIRSEALYFALDCLPFLLATSNESEELAEQAAQVGCVLRLSTFKTATKKARVAIAEYLERVEMENL
ncbi:hypothetical protein GALMADRAFT_281904 [Galerina marginata CBS 339.88]|uniref:Uncharacterized protein n=1 Tax=Galerina marginata (strain CBS 339.88) TaxID=685588 RepID=A0A067SMQ3_GALM3|nr:hypothetical protein GALMADRAFT_281904 [Galerina marginata CBS 339.88]